MKTHVNAVRFRAPFFTVCLSPVLQSSLKSDGRGPLSPSSSLLAASMHRSRAAQLGDPKSGERQIHSLLLPLFRCEFSCFDSIYALYISIDHSVRWILLSSSTIGWSRAWSCSEIFLPFGVLLITLGQMWSFLPSFFPAPVSGMNWIKKKTATCWMELGSLDIWRDTFNHCFCGLLLEMNC